MRFDNKIKEQKTYQLTSRGIKVIVFFFLVVLAGGGALGFMAGKKYSSLVTKSTDLKSAADIANPVLRNLYKSVCESPEIFDTGKQDMEKEFIENFNQYLDTKDKKNLVDDSKLTLLLNKEKHVDKELEEMPPQVLKKGKPGNLDDIIYGK